MSETPPFEKQNTTIDEEYRKSMAKSGKQPLSDMDLLIITCEEISRTFTFQEKGYNLPGKQ